MPGSRRTARRADKKKQLCRRHKGVLRSGEQCAVAEGVRRDNRRNRKGAAMAAAPFLTAQLLGPQPSPARWKSVGEGRKKRRSKGAEGGMPRQGRPDGSGLCDDEGGWYSDPVALRRGQAPALQIRYPCA